MSKRIQLIAAGVGAMLVLIAVPSAASAGKLTTPIVVKSHRDQVETSHGFYCPDNASCAAAPGKPRPKPRLRTHGGGRLVLVTATRPKRVAIQLTRPKHNPHNGTVTLARLHPHAAGEQRRHWHFGLPNHCGSATALQITASYRHGTSFYLAGIRVSTR